MFPDVSTTRVPIYPVWLLALGSYMLVFAMAHLAHVLTAAILAAAILAAAIIAVAGLSVTAVAGCAVVAGIHNWERRW